LMLDTTAVSEFFRGNEEVRACLENAEVYYLNPVVIGELLSGFMSGKHEKKNRESLEAFISSTRVGVVDMDEETSERYAVILSGLRKAGTPIPTNDIWIASSAMQYGLTILTTDKHYVKVPQVLTELCGAS
jgi:tRNA(fMet)-specific endonuclease VapC